MSHKLSVILVGLPHHHDTIPAAMRDDVETSLAQISHTMHAAGITFKWISVAPEDSIITLKSELKARSPDAVVIAFGVRGNPKLTPFFEQLVDAIHLQVPNAKLLFNTHPNDTLDAV